MKNTDFDSKRIARGYVNRPWLHKNVMEQYIKDNAFSGKLSHGLDVGCGAGLSTKALHLICDNVTGTDNSLYKAKKRDALLAIPIYQLVLEYK